MSALQLAKIVERLGPHIQGSSLRRSRLVEVLSAFDATGDVAQRVEEALTAARIRVHEDLALPSDSSGRRPANPPTPSHPEPPSGDGGGPEQAIDAARRRMDADRSLARPEKVLLSAQEEVGLTLILRGPEGKPLKQGALRDLTGERRRAAEALILHNLRLVHHIAQRFLVSGMEFEDLYQGGMPGLFRAVELFDPAAGNKFSTYATHWIRQSISRTVANESRLIRLPVHMFERLQKVWATRERLTVGGLPPTAQELAKECGLSIAEVVDCLKLGPPPASLDKPVDDSGTTTLGDLVDRGEHRPEHIEVRGFVPDDVLSWLAVLTDKQAAVLRLRFGLTSDQEPMTLDEIGKQFGVTRERIRQIEGKALGLIREHVARIAPQAFGVPGRRRATDQP